MGKCSLCGREMAVRFSVRDHLRPADSTVYEVGWCDPCAYGTVCGHFDSAAVSRFYASGHPSEDVVYGRAAHWLDRLRVGFARWLDRGADLDPDELARTLSLTGRVPTLCDVGCGTGRAMKLFSSSGFEAIGVEPDNAARSLASRYGQVFNGTAEELPQDLDGQQFSVVLLSHVLEHCIDPVAALCNVKQLLAPGGTLVVEVPNNACAGFLAMGPSWLLFDVPRHLHFFTRRSLDHTLEAAGFKVVRRIYRGYARQMTPDWARAENSIREKLGLHGLKASAWSLLARTIFSTVDAKYDSIRVHALHT